MICEMSDLPSFLQYILIWRHAQGMSIARLPNGRVGYEGSMHSRAQRLRISISIAALRSIWWLGSTAICLWHNVTSVLLGTDAYALHPA